MRILVIAEHDQKELKPATLHCLRAAESLGDEIDLLIMGSSCEALAKSACELPNLKKVLLADQTVYEHQLAENCSELIAKYGQNYDYILAASTTFGKNLLPRAAALLDVSMISDVIEILDRETFVRPMYAGNVIARVKTQEKIKILTIRTTSFPLTKENEKRKASLETLTDVIPNNVSQFESQQLTKSSRPELTAARIIVSGGRGLKSADNFKMLQDLADQLGAAIGASRAAVDAGFVPNDYQVGQTGKIVAPELYIAIGISGAIQHIAGMKDSKIIVAINNDPDAPIFQMADYVLVGDLFEIVPALQRALETMHA